MATFGDVVNLFFQTAGKGAIHQQQVAERGGDYMQKDEMLRRGGIESLLKQQGGMEALQAGSAERAVKGAQLGPSSGNEFRDAAQYDMLVKQLEEEAQREVQNAQAGELRGRGDVRMAELEAKAREAAIAREDQQLARQDEIRLRAETQGDQSRETARLVASLRPTPAPPAPKPIPGMQMQALAYHNRAKEALASAELFEDSVAKSGLMSQARLAFAPNILQSAEGQGYRQAQRAFTEARLRKESGAAVPEHEYVNDAVTYFAQPGDRPETIEQKRQARHTVLQGLAYSSGRAYEDYYGAPMDKAGASAVTDQPTGGWKDPGGAAAGNRVRIRVDANGNVIQ